MSMYKVYDDDQLRFYISKSVEITETVFNSLVTSLGYSVVGYNMINTAYVELYKQPEGKRLDNMLIMSRSLGVEQFYIVDWNC